MADPANSSRVKKVSIRTPSGTKEIEAALVVDCTGPARVGVKMLERAGYGNAESYSKGTLPLNELKVTYDQKIRYSTFDFPIPSDLAKRLPIPGGFEGGGAVYATLTEPGKDRRSIYASRVDGDRLQLCFGTWADDDLPRTLQAAKEYMNTMVLQLPPPEWFSEMLDLLAEVEDRMTFSVVHVPPTSYIRFHQAVSLPSNWVAIGDSVMRLNPVFGQGCSKALIGAITLNTALHEAKVNGNGIPSNFSKSFFKLQQPKIEGFWEGTKNYDYSYDTTVPITGETLTTGSILRWYMRRLQTLALTDKQANSAFWHSGMILSPGITVFQPLIVMKILWSLVVQRCT
ncbi:hypothetical protein SERLADRAFT_476950 [Serpula lacrymans var. lacrymans S7.9]|nr:uncharacterized protein SERLADRAFT_476950 [Serpula lacrymans var. lacrymans S7.9]EGO20597.1 hypothetical protein SERLADRAFT_476950 [Serpula lacrymans var. lacrymans S7.9]